MKMSLVAATTALIMCPALFGSIIEFTDRNSFLSELNGAHNIGFENIAPPGGFVTYGSAGLTLAGVNFVGLQVGWELLVADGAYRSDGFSYSLNGSASLVGLHTGTATDP